MSLPDVEYGKECKDTVMGREYQGQVSVTLSGKVCQIWASQSPHPHGQLNPQDYPDRDAEESQNFCRNPDNSTQGPWCYTTDPDTRWESCDIPLCSGII